MTFDSNNPEYAWRDVQVVIDGKLITRIKGVKFSVKKEKSFLHARGENPHTIQSGNKTYEGEIMLTQSAVETMAAGLEPDEDLTDLLGHNIVVAFVLKSNPTKIITYILKGVEYTEDNRELGQGDPFMEITLPIMFLSREVA